MTSPHLIGIGYRHIRTGAGDSFEGEGKKIRKSGRDAADSTGALESVFGRLRGAASVAVAGVAAVTAAIAAYSAVAIGAIRNSAEFEAGLIGVGKTANLEGTRLAKLGSEIDALSRRLPNNTQELLAIAQAAGQLGVKGEPAILAFTDTIARLGSASDLAGEEAASALARILNVTGESAESVGTLASVIVSLGNNFAATESQIARHTGEVARATAVYKIGSAEAAAIATTLAAFGVQAELAGSSVGRSFRMIETAVKSGGDAMERLSALTGKSAAEITEAFGRSPVEAFNLFLGGLRRVIDEGGNVAAALKTMKLGGEENAKVLPVLAAQLETLSQAQALAAKETEHATALQTESDKALESAQSQWALLRNEISSASRLIGDELLPVAVEIIQETRSWISRNRDTARSLGEDLGPALRAAGRALIFFLENLELVKASLIAFLALKVIVWFTSFVAAVHRAVVALGVYVTSSAAATASTVALGAAVTRVSPILDQYGRAIVTTSAATAAAGASGAKFLSLGITPLAAGLAVLLGGLLATNGAITSWARTMVREIAEVAAKAAEFADRIAGIRTASEELLDVARQEAEIKKRLLAEGLGAEDEGAAAIRAQVAADFQRQRVELLTAQSTELETARQKEAEYRAELQATIDKLPELEAAEEAARKTRTAGGLGAELAQLQDANKAGAAVGAARAEIERLQIAANEAHAEVRTLEESTRRLTAAAKEYKPAAVATGAAGRGLGEATKKQKEFLASLLETIAGLEAEARATAALAGAQQHGAEAVADTAAEMEIQRAIAGELAEAQKAGVDKTEAFIKAMGAFTEALRRAAEEQRELSGSTTIAALERQLAKQQAINEAWAQGPEAVAAVTDALALQEEQEERSTTAADAQRNAIRDLVAELARWQKANEQAARVDDITHQRDELRRMVDAYKAGTRAVLEETAALRVENAVRQATADLYGKAAEKMAELTKERELEAAILAGRETIAALEAEVALLVDLAKIKRGFSTEREYQQALANTNLEHEIRVALLAIEQQRLVALAAMTQMAGESEGEYAARVAALNAEFAIQAGTVEGLLRQRAKLSQDNEAGARDLAEEWIRAGEAIVQVLTGIDEGLGNLLASVLSVIEGFRGLQDLQKGDYAGAVLGGAGVGAGIAGIGQQFGVVKPRGRAGNFGGALSGNYGAEGGAIGGIIGAIVGSIVPGIGTAIGALVGSLIGTVVGSFVKSGADEALATLTQVGDDIKVNITKAEGNLHPAMKELTSTVVDIIGQIEDAIGVAITTGEFSFKIRDDVISVFINGMTARFTDMADAVNFAIVQVLATAEFGEGLGDAVRIVLERGADSIDELMAGLDLASMLDRGTAAARPLADAMREISILRARETRLAREFGLALDRVLELTNERIRLLKREVEQSYNNLLGVQDYLGVAQQFEAAVNDFNAGLQSETDTRNRNIAALKAQHDAYEQQLADVQAQIDAMGGFEAVRAEAAKEMELFRETMGDGITGGFEAAEGSAADLIKKLLAAQAGMARTAADIAALEASLAGLPDAIDVQKIADVFNAAASQAGIDLVGMLRQVRGENFLNVELQELQARLFRLQLAAQIASVQALLASTTLLDAATRGLLEKILDEAGKVLAGLESGDLTLRGGSGRGQARRAAAESFEDALASLQATLAGTSDLVQGFEAELQRFADLADEGRIPVERLNEAIAALAALQLADIEAPFLDAARRETGSQAAYREAGEAAAQALADAAAIGVHNPEVWARVRAAIEAGLDAQLQGIGEEALVALGDRIFELELSTAATIAEIGFLLDHLDELGLTAGQVAGAVRRGLVGSLFDLIEAQARRVGDEQAVEAIQRRRAAFELAFARLQFEHIVMVLEAADAITPGLQAMIDRGRELFDLPGLDDDGTGAGLASLADALERLVDQAGPRSIAAIRQANRAYEDLARQIRETTMSEQERAAALAIAEAERQRAHQEAALGLLGEIEALARAAGVELPVEMAREWAEIQFNLARAQILVALASQDMQAALVALGVDIGALTGFVLGLELPPATGGPPTGPQSRLGIVDRSGWNQQRPGAAGSGVDALAALREELERMARAAEIARMDEFPGAVARINDQFDDLVERLQTAGATQADLAEAERLRLDELGRLIEETFERATADIRALLDELRGGELSGRPAQDRLGEQMAALQDLAARAMGGDLAALEQASGQARAVIDLIAQVFGSGQAAAALQAQVEAMLAQLVGLGPGSLPFAPAGTPMPMGVPAALGAPSPAPAPAGISSDARAYIDALREENRLLRQALAAIGKDAQDREEARHGETIGQLVAIREEASQRGGFGAGA